MSENEDVKIDLSYCEEIRLINKARNKNKLVIFVGAGISLPSGMPSWKDSIKKFYNKLGTTNISENEYFKIPQLYFNSRGEKEYNELVKEIFKYSDKKPNPTHELIVKLNPRHVITTNYDDFLERSFRSKGEFLEIIERNNDIPYADNGKFLIKMHGGFNHNNFVLKEDDYLNYSNNFSMIELLVKSLIAQNTVLFLGYSYNDPDTKHIFNWVKNILGKDFQRAYMVQHGNDYDLHTVNYYKNLGINILYAKGDGKNNTNNFINSILEDKERKGLIEIDDFRYINYVMIRDLKLEHPKVTNNEYDLEFDKKQLKNDETNIFTQNEMKLLDEKTFVKNIYITDDESFEFPTAEKVNLNKFEKSKLLDSDFAYCINTLNFLELKKISNEIDIYDDNLDNQLLLKIAFSLYHIGEYKKCYDLLKMISFKYLKEKNYIWHFICEFNRKYIGLLWDMRDYKEIFEEANKINLEDILFKNQIWSEIPLNIRKLVNFNFANELLSEILNIIKKVEKDAESQYITYTGTPNIINLEYKIIDLNNYINFNFLMVDKYTEIINIYKEFIRVSLYSFSKKIIDNELEIKSKNNIDYLKTYNIAISNISEFMISIICSYYDYKEFNQLLSEYKIKELILDNIKTRETLFKIFDNLCDSCKDKELKVPWLQNRINMILTLFRFIKIDSNEFKKIIVALNNLFAKNIIWILFYCLDYITDFTIVNYNSNRRIVDKKSLLEMVEVLLNISTNQDLNPHEIKYMERFLNNISVMVEGEIIQDTLIEKLILSNSREYITRFLISVFKISSKNIKLKISKIMEDSLNENFDGELYKSLILNEIINPSEEFEDKLFKLIDESKDKEYILEICVNIHLDNKFLDSSKLGKYFENASNEKKFLYDMDNFDYSEFDLIWFKSFRKRLIEVIANNDIAYNNIKKILSKNFKQKNYDDQLVKIYFGYFNK